MSKNKKTDFTSEWNFPVDVTHIGISPRVVELSAPEDVRQVLARRLGLLSLESLEARLTLSRGDGSAVLTVEGQLNARLTQSCVVTLDPVQSKITEAFEAWFADPQAAVSLVRARHDRKVKKGHVETPVLSESEDPEPVVDGHIDAGELVVQHLSLAIDPYPHKEGVRFEAGDDVPSPMAAAGPQKNPFAALKDWKDKLKPHES